MTQCKTELSQELDRIRKACPDDEVYAPLLAVVSEISSGYVVRNWDDADTGALEGAFIKVFTNLMESLMVTSRSHEKVSRFGNRLANVLYDLRILQFLSRDTRLSAAQLVREFVEGEA